jgi:3-hydroxymyristoyl/3-hydroxydecanoyl-(acyl carrier protein) dehydratase
MPPASPRAWTARFAVAATHPCLPGHFPGQPLVPGVLLLDHVFQAMREAGLPPPARLLRAKFTAPVRPGQVVELTLREAGAARIGFLGTCDGIAVLAGEVALPAAAPA